MNKYYNDAIIGNNNITASFSKKGELLRLNFPNIDYKQFIDFFHIGLKINDSNIIYLHDDINNVYNQYYTENTNILNTEIENTYFNLAIKQLDFVSVKENILIKKYEFINNHNIPLDINFLAYSKLLTDSNNMVSAKVENDRLYQYTHDYTVCMFSNNKIYSHQLNNVEKNIEKAIIYDKDYIGMSPDSCVSFDLGTIKPKEKVEISFFICINKNEDKKDNLKFLSVINTKKEFIDAKKYWEKHVEKYMYKFDKNISKYDKIKKIYARTILLFPLLINHETGGISASMEIDEKMTTCGRYSYCWPRDAVFITKALDILKMNEETEKFYKVFCKKTQSDNGMWEQRFYTDGKLAPCWGYQIDETASVIYGVYEHYLFSKKVTFLKGCLQMCERAVDYLRSYIDNLIDNTQIQDSYDLWEMNEGIHLYSLSAIYRAFKSMIKIYEVLVEKYNINVDVNIELLRQYSLKVKKYILENLCENGNLKRNKKDCLVDISMLGTIVPFEVFGDGEKVINNLIEKINVSLRTYNGGYLRFEADHYRGGKNPWVISCLWMALYYIKIGDKNKALECFDFVVNTANYHGFLAEQVDNDTMEPIWVIGLGWSHALFVIVCNELWNLKNKKKED